MQNRYAGDIGDFGKLGLLRRLRQTGLSIGVNWYLTPDETHNGDGRHVGYLKNDMFRACDEQLWSALGQIVKSGNRQVCELESAGILQGTFYSRMLDFTGARLNGRCSAGNGTTGPCSSCRTVTLSLLIPIMG